MRFKNFEEFLEYAREKYNLGKFHKENLDYLFMNLIEDLAGIPILKREYQYNAAIRCLIYIQQLIEYLHPSYDTQYALSWINLLEEEKNAPKLDEKK